MFPLTGSWGFCVELDPVVVVVVVVVAVVPDAALELGSSELATELPAAGAASELPGASLAASAAFSFGFV